ncbi:Na+/H+ antiporter [Entomophthora muscae]|uniref:Na+/H+ antiporter n=1 Tax=Entomophthora muscae TaxID=34485 RepID=A0ACC2TWZ2_9FUNG|nr:Na+/H+ antiporter [Entomophthora muscae]
MLKEARSLAMLLLPVMFAAWLVSGAIIYAFFPLSYLEALVISSCITPTDPVLANSIVKGRFAEKYVPVHVRDLISAESGANDGLGFPYLFFAIFMLEYNTTREALGEWFIMIWGYQIFLSIVIGLAAGYAARKVLQYSYLHDMVDKESLLAYWLALALFLMGTVAIIGSDDLFCCFVAGNSFNWDNWFHSKTQEGELQEVVDMLFNFSFFIYFGTAIPWAQFSSQLGSLVAAGTLVILFRRIPGLLLATPYISALYTWREAIFAGWFGPIGVGAIFYAMVAIEELESYENEYRVVPYIFPIVSFMVLCSIVVHGVTIPIFMVGKQLKARAARPPATYMLQGSKLSPTLARSDSSSSTTIDLD